MWRLVIEDMATLEEIERSWSLSDIIRGNHVLSLRRAAERPKEDEP